MCLDDIDSNSDPEETNESVDGVSHRTGTELRVAELVENEINTAKENGKDGAVLWLELEELDIDDDTLLSLDLSSRFPV